MWGVQSVTGAWRRVWNLPSWLNICTRGPSVCTPAFLKSRTNIEIDNECDPCRSWQVLRGGLSKSSHPAHPPNEWRQKKCTIDPVLLFIRMCLMAFSDSQLERSVFYLPLNDQQVAVFAALLAVDTGGIKTVNNINLLYVHIDIIVKYRSAVKSLMNCFNPRLYWICLDLHVCCISESDVCQDASTHPSEAW